MKLVARRGSPFRTEEGAVAFGAMMKDGPLVRILREETLRLAPAKGAERFREKHGDIFEQTYFVHSLNVSLTGALLFEALTTAAGSPATEGELRVVLAAGALHDFNKLESLVGTRNLSAAFTEVEGEARKLLGDYVPEKDVADVLHLALDAAPTEGKDSSKYSLRMAARRATMAALCLQLADQLAGTHADPNDATDYVTKVAKFRAQWSEVPFPEIHVQTLTALPQPALARAARQAFLDWIRDHGTLLHETERYVTWMGPVPGEGDFLAMGEGLWERIRPSPDDAFEKSKPSHNSLRTTWAQVIPPTPESVDAWIEKFGGRLVLWSGSWGTDHFRLLEKDFPGVFVYDAPSSNHPEGRVRVDLPERDESRPQPGRVLAKLVIAHCIHQFLLDVRAPPPGPHPGYSTSARDAMVSTIPGILWAKEQRQDPKAYSFNVEQIANLVRAREKAGGNPVQGVVAALLGWAGPTPMAPTGEACIYCGTSSSTEVEDALVFGIKPTAWAPRKKGVQSESHRGRLCERCVVENQLRHQAAASAGAPSSEKEFLTVHIHAADLVCDVNWEPLLRFLDPEVIADGEAKLILFPKAKKDAGKETKGGFLVPLRGHVSVPFARPSKSGKTSETLAELYRLRDLLRFVRRTGFKIHVSPLALNPIQERAMFRWTNAPVWARELGLAEVHVDDLLPRPNRTVRPSPEEIVEGLLQAGRAVGGSQGHRTFLSHLQRDPLSVYEAADSKSTPPGTGGHFLDILEDAFVPPTQQASLAQIALPFIRFNKRGEWTNNTWTWATRDYLELRDRYRTEPDARALIVGDLAASAKRKWDGAPIEHIEAFADAMETYLSAFRGGQSPIGPDRRVLINAVAYTCRKNYRSVFPKVDEKEGMS